MRYPQAEWVPWKYESSQGPTYFRGINKPVAVVLHVAQGYASTARAWAAQGHYGASWHYTVGRDGSVMQHLEHTDGGYHAGIASPPAPTPTWALWKGSHLNVNCYTIGIEHEGFSGDGFTEPQREASRALCRWLGNELSFKYDRDHFPPHADIDLINRPLDFAPPEGREAHYQFMFEEDEMTPDEKEMLYELTRAMTGFGETADALPRLKAWNYTKSGDFTGNSLLDGYTEEQKKLGEHLGNHPGASTVAKHSHPAMTTIGDPK